MIEILAQTDEEWAWFLIIMGIIQLWILIWFIMKMRRIGKSLEAIEIIGRDILAFQKWQCEVKQEEHRN
jgi:hypothetical protein